MHMDNFIHLACIFSVKCKMLRLSAFNKSITYLLTYLLKLLARIEELIMPMPFFIAYIRYLECLSKN